MAQGECSEQWSKALTNCFIKRFDRTLSFLSLSPSATWQCKNKSDVPVGRGESALGTGNECVFGQFGQGVFRVSRVARRQHYKSNKSQENSSFRGSLCRRGGS